VIKVMKVRSGFRSDLTCITYITCITFITARLRAARYALCNLITLCGVAIP
jgi:hypothetical protein